MEKKQELPPTQQQESPTTNTNLSPLPFPSSHGGAKAAAKHTFQFVV